MTTTHSLHEKRVITSTGMELPDWSMRFGSGAVTYATETILSTYERSNGDPWVLTHVKVKGGRRLVNDGISTLTVQSESWYVRGHHDHGTCPEWLFAFASQWLDDFNKDGGQ